jgi:fused signal recognition particle receptor
LFRRREKLRHSLTRTRQSLWGRLRGLFGPGEVTEDFWAELETLLIQADVGVDTTVALVEWLREEADRRGLRQAAAVEALLRERLVTLLRGSGLLPLREGDPLTVVLVVGVNGTGKTTSIAKLTRYYQERGKRVLLVAGDTFRAAAIDQLRIWGKRVGADVIAGQPGGDPAAVVFDAIQAARARNADVLVADTAGRLHTKYNLMEELKKVRRVVSRQDATAPHETFLVLDATTGQNALLQARTFKEAVEVTGVILAKLDGTAKGGIVFAISSLGLPIRFVGTGEKLDDLAEFDAETFVEGLFEK